MTGWYKLVDRRPVPVRDMITWARWIETADRTVRQENVGPLRVSTVFLGLDHSFDGGPPLLFETMIFDGFDDGYQERYSTWAEAERGHERAVAHAMELVAKAGRLLIAP